MHLDDRQHIEIATFASVGIERSLANLLKVHFADADESYVENAFGSFGPLQPFSSKILVARLIGAIPTALADELDTLDGIQNRFTHDVVLATFSDEGIVSRANHLRMVSINATQAALTASDFDTSVEQDTSAANGRKLEIAVFGRRRRLFFQIAKFADDGSPRSNYINAAKSVLLWITLQALQALLTRQHRVGLRR